MQAATDKLCTGQEGLDYDAAIVKDGEKYYGHQLQPQTVEFMSDVVEQLRRLENILREYDLAVSGDSCEATFQERVGITPNMA